jgi:hypothetical protein
MSRERSTQQRTEGKDKPSSLRNLIEMILIYILTPKGVTHALQVHLHL